MIPVYAKDVARGEVVPDALPEVASRRGATSVVDARHGWGHPAMMLAVGEAVRSAGEHGVGVAAVKHSHHFGACGYYAREVTRRGYLAIVSTTSRTVAVVPARGAEPRLGTNPIAIAAPTSSGSPLMIDMSTATVALNKVKVYSLKGAELPAGWVVDEHGSDIRDPDLAMDYLRNRPTGGITPLGGTPELSAHKGYGLGVGVQLLAATLVGAAFSATREAGSKEDIGHFVMALDPESFRSDGGLIRDVDEIAEELRSTKPADPELPVLAPGDPETTTRELRSVTGVPLSGTLIDQLREVCSTSGADFILTGGEMSA